MTSQFRRICAAYTLLTDGKDPKQQRGVIEDRALEYADLLLLCHEASKLSSQSVAIAQVELGALTPKTFLNVFGYYIRQVGGWWVMGIGTHLGAGGAVITSFCPFLTGSGHQPPPHQHHD